MSNNEQSEDALLSETDSIQDEDAEMPDASAETKTEPGSNQNIPL